MSETEVKKYLKEKKRKCSKCGGHVTTVALSVGWCDECCKCDHRWNFTDPAGRRITEEEYDERLARMNRKQRQGTPTMSVGEDSEGVRLVSKKSKKSKKNAAVEAEAKEKKEKKGKKGKAEKSSKSALLAAPGTKVEASRKGKTYLVEVTKDGYKAGKKTGSNLRELAQALTGKPHSKFLVRAFAKKVTSKGKKSK